MTNSMNYYAIYYYAIALELCYYALATMGLAPIIYCLIIVPPTLT